MPAIIQPLLLLLQQCHEKHDTQLQRGRPLVYGRIAMLLFFITMAIKKIHAFKTMAAYAQVHYRAFGFPAPPSRKTLRRRFLALPGYLHGFMPALAVEVGCLDERFHFRTAFVDKSIFRACGGIWHKKHRLQGIVPHPSIDTDASWGKSPYHGWRFGYGLHVVANGFRFPVMASVTTASLKDYHQLLGLLAPLARWCHLVVGDAGYRSIRVIRHVWNHLKVFVLTRSGFKGESANKRWYNRVLAHHCAGALYRRRKPAIEPVFSLIKVLFDLQREHQLPYKGLAKVEAYLMLATASVQVLMIVNSIHQHPLQATQPFRFALD